MTVICAAIDLGASSGRVIVAELASGRIALNEVHRFETPVIAADVNGYLTWDIDAIIEQVNTGVAKADAVAPLASVGADTWGVDYVLVDRDGRPVAPAVAYRDSRTTGMVEEVSRKIPKATIYAKTGIQFMSINTLYQFAACARRTPRWFDNATRMLMIPDYIHYRLSGVMANEYTNATTTQAYSLHLDDWDPELLAAVGIPSRLLGHPVEPGTIIGEMASPSGRGSIAVIAPATHDTASAVVAAPLQSEDDAYISSGTWSLMGIESRTPFADEKARAVNLSNEGGYERRYRVLENIMGLWLIERVRKELGAIDHGVLVAEAAVSAGWRSVVNPEAPRFLNPDSMIASICAFCAETGQPVPEERGAIARCVYDSLALSYRRVKEDLESVRGRPLKHIRIVGGGSRNALLNQLCADACQLPVSAGPVETTALGNACVQMIALGALADLDEARAVIRASFPLAEFQPSHPVPDAVWDRFRAFGKR
jgi:rhamnulokinase